MSKMVFWVLDVGQGSGNFIQVFDDSDKLVGSVLIDIGSKKSKKAAAAPRSRPSPGCSATPPRSTWSCCRTATATTST